MNGTLEIDIKDFLINDTLEVDIHKLLNFLISNYENEIIYTKILIDKDESEYKNLKYVVDEYNNGFVLLNFKQVYDDMVNSKKYNKDEIEEKAKLLYEVYEKYKLILEEK